MWLISGIAAIVTAALNVISAAKKKEAKWFRFGSLSLTALTLCAFYSAGADWISQEDWAAAADVLPTMSKLLWGLTTVSILLNSVSLFGTRE